MSFFRNLFDRMLSEYYPQEGQPEDTRPPQNYFTSDEHYGHRNIIEYAGRPFKSVEEMDAALVFNHNRVVRPCDTVYHLGDFCWSDTRVGNYLAQLNGTHVLIPGNHDKCFPTHKKWGSSGAKYVKAGFANVVQGAPWGHLVLTRNGKVAHVRRDDPVPSDLWGHAVARLAHMPYYIDFAKNFEDPRYGDARPTPVGLPLIHGHIHEKWRTWGRRIAVCVEQWDFTPVHSSVLVQLSQEASKATDEGALRVSYAGGIRIEEQPPVNERPYR